MMCARISGISLVNRVENSRMPIDKSQWLGGYLPEGLNDLDELCNVRQVIGYHYMCTR